MSNFESQLISCLKALDQEDLLDLAGLIDENLLHFETKDLCEEHKEDYERNLGFIAEVIVARLVDMEELNKVIEEDWEKVKKSWLRNAQQT